MNGFKIQDISPDKTIYVLTPPAIGVFRCFCQERFWKPAPIDQFFHADFLLTPLELRKREREQAMDEKPTSQRIAGLTKRIEPGAPCHKNLQIRIFRIENAL